MSHTPAFPIVGIGASAGGVEALEGFFRGLPSQPGLAVIIVTHLSPTHESSLPDILARFTEMPVNAVQQGAEVHANAVHVLSSDAVLGIERGRLQLRRQPSGRRERKPIDIFFSALARDCGELSVGVVLSGGDSDGTLGLKAIKEHGGLTLAQVADGFGPGHPDMPASAIASGFVDLALPADQMGAKLVQFVHDPDWLVSLSAEADEPRDQMLRGMKPEICALLRNRLGHDFSGYKTRTFLRRVQRRMQVTQLANHDAYLERLRRDDPCHA